MKQLDSAVCEIQDELLRLGLFEYLELNAEPIAK